MTFKTEKGKTNPCQFNIYIPEKDRETVKKAQEIFDREGSSISKFVTEKLAEYVRLHEPGNPQQRLDTIAKIGGIYRANGCSVTSCGAVGEYVVFKSGVRVLFCERHFWGQPLRGRKLTP